MPESRSCFAFYATELASFPQAITGAFPHFGRDFSIRKALPKERRNTAKELAIGVVLARVAT
jgi:hypothetical protein